jgi:hypothetical protein
MSTFAKDARAVYAGVPMGACLAWGLTVVQFLLLILWISKKLGSSTIERTVFFVLRLVQTARSWRRALQQV